MSHSAPNTSLSLSARLLVYLGPPSTILLTAYASPQTALLSPLAFLPTALSLKKWRQLNTTNPSPRGELEPMVWTYFTAGTLGISAVGVTQIAILKAVTRILFPSFDTRSSFIKEFFRSSIADLSASELSHRADLAASWQNWVFNFGFMFIAAGLVEETLKYLPVIYAARRDPEKRRNRSYLDYSLSAALSFGVLEGIGYIYAARSEESWPIFLLTLVERLVIGQIGHLSAAALTALRAIRRDYYGDKLSWWGVVGPAALFHGTFNFVAMSGSAMEGNVGWIHPSDWRIVVPGLGILTGLVATMVGQVRREWKDIENRDRVSQREGDEGTKK